jgi:hypothetical protein
VRKGCGVTRPDFDLCYWFSCASSVGNLTALSMSSSLFPPPRLLLPKPFSGRRVSHVPNRR